MADTAWWVSWCWWVGLGCTHSFVFVFGLGVGIIRGEENERKLWQGYCVRRGIAHWIADSKGQSEFRWYKVKDIIYEED